MLLYIRACDDLTDAALFIFMLLNCAGTVPRLDCIFGKYEFG
jgi:hypothetical protein